MSKSVIQSLQKWQELDNNPYTALNLYIGFDTAGLSWKMAVFRYLFLRRNELFYWFRFRVLRILCCSAGAGPLDRTVRVPDMDPHLAALYRCLF